jgi:hypothetical protein
MIAAVVVVGSGISSYVRVGGAAAAAPAWRTCEPTSGITTSRRAADEDEDQRIDADEVGSEVARART